MATPLAMMCIARQNVTVDTSMRNEATTQQLSAEDAVFKPGSSTHHLGLAIAKVVSEATADFAALMPSLCRSRPRPKRTLVLDSIVQAASGLATKSEGQEDEGEVKELDEIPLAA